MAVKYVKEFDYPSEGGFHKSKMPSRAMPNAPARGAARMESKPKMGKGQGYAMGGKVPGREMDKLPAKKPPGRGKDLAAAKPERGQYQGYAKGGKIQKYAKGGEVQKYADGRLVANPNVASPNRQVVPGIGAGYRGSYQTPVEVQWLQSWAKSQGMSPHKFENMVNNLIKSGSDAPAAIQAAGKSGMMKGAGVGTPLGILGGALGTAYGPDIMNYLQSLMNRAKPTVTVEEIPQPQGRARGGSIKKSYGRKR
jgi:hypothetical protein